MAINKLDNPEDVAACIKEGRTPREHGPYRIQIGDADLSFKDVLIEDPVPTGRQVLEKAGLYPATEHLLFAKLKDGALDAIRLDETVDIFPRGVEKFIFFHSDRSFLFVLNDRRFTWGASTITGTGSEISGQSRCRNARSVAGTAGRGRSPRCRR